MGAVWMRAWSWVCRVGWPWLFRCTEFAAFIVAIAGVVVWWREAPDRRKERHYRAWELINSAAFLPADGGRSDALETLAKDGRSLAGAFLDLAHLPEINLGSSRLSGQRVNLSRASMKNAQLYGADLEGAVLDGADLTDADLSSSLSCPGTDYHSSSSDYPVLPCQEPHAERRTNLKGASLMLAKLQGAHLINADLNGASLTYAVLDDADLKGADLTCADLDWVNLARARGLEASQLKTALGGRRTTLPEYLEFEPPCHWSGYPEEDCAEPICPPR